MWSPACWDIPFHTDVYGFAFTCTSRLLLLFCVRAKICSLWLFWRNLYQIKVSCVIHHEHVWCLFYYTVHVHALCINLIHGIIAEIIVTCVMKRLQFVPSFLCCPSLILKLLTWQLKFIIPLLKELEIICITINDAHFLLIANG